MIGSTDFPKISHLKKRAFLAAFSRCGSLSKAAKRARVDRRTHYNWLKDDSWYVHAFRQAVIEAGDSLQDKLTEIAFEGNVTAAIFLLKGLKPETFRDRIEQVNIQDIDPAKMSPELLDKIANRMIEQALGAGAAAEVDRRLKAGESVELEDLQKAIEAPGEPLTIEAVCQAVNDRPGQR
jgi:hypothetical protein